MSDFRNGHGDRIPLDPGDPETADLIELLTYLGSDCPERDAAVAGEFEAAIDRNQPGHG
ncbi:hypothetical protein [Kitasatospora sp. NPDC047058]|uniref:hypothetical protein n=1 Tax=Kitasatospora sp. NPDC047058 TaxID=3155620 RepID=UPI0033F68A2A